MKSSIISFVFFLSTSTLVSAGPVAAIGRGVAGIVSGVIGGKKNKRDFFDNDYDLAVALVSRDHSIQEWIDLTYKPYDGSGISKQITDLLAQLGRTPPPPGMNCPTKTNRIPQFAHKLHVSETHPIPRDQAIGALTLMTQEQDPNKKLFFAALEVAMQLNCWTVPKDIRAVIHTKGWMQSVAASQATQAPLGTNPPVSNPAPRSINEEDDFDVLTRNALEDDSLDTELYSRDAEAEADAMFDLWIREADAEADADAKARSMRFLGKR